MKPYNDDPKPREHDGDITPGMTSYYGEADTNSMKQPLPKSGWGAHGVRWDEDCAHCGRTTEIDNNTELCVRCQGGK